MKKIIFVFLSLVICLFVGCVNTPDDNEIDEKGEIDMNLFTDAKTMRLSSFYTGSVEEEVLYIKQVVPYDDEYTFKTNNNTVYRLFDDIGDMLIELGPLSLNKLTLRKGQVVYAEISNLGGESIDIEVKLKENKKVMPYDPINLVDGEALLKEKKDTVDPLIPAELNYVKRPGGLYINCNNPERLQNSCLGKALTRNDVSNKEVFFTYEHNNSISRPFYYGYQVRNNGTEDIYITVKNIGFQLDGPGCWLGEREWIEFYNTEFRIKNIDKYTESQKATFEAFFGFSNIYKSQDYQPITYRVPAGEYIYVMGGTTKDAYHNINVFKTANEKIASGCSNGAVLFEVVGENVEGCFYVYDDYKTVGMDNKTHQGYIASYEGDNHVYGRQYVGSDNCHGVVDCNITWEFNDSTPSQILPVSFTNRYDETLPKGEKPKGTPFGLVENTKEHRQYVDVWYTHINPQDNHHAVGTDMTKYYTVDKDGNPICIDYEHFDGLGYTANIGNWMIDYMDNYTFVNHGSKERTIKLTMVNTGSLAIMVRDQNGNIIEGTPQYTIIAASSSYGAAIYDTFEYIVTVPANSYLQFTVEYNLLANSSGNVSHKVVLG